jgi:hypothetical protein
MRSDMKLAMPHLFRPFTRPVLASAALALMVAFAPVSAQAQAAPGGEDLRALIYYLDTDDQRSVQAEIRRLRAQFPGWTPPSDMNTLRQMGPATAATVDVAQIWARIERGDNAGARAMIDEARRNAPAWSPDAEMLRLLELNEGQAAFDAAVMRRDSSAAIATARRTPALMRCDRINNAWQLAEMYQVAGQRDNAVGTYRGVLGACSGLTDTVATLEKANEVANIDELAQLFDVARAAGPGNAAQLNALEARLRAGRGAAPRTPGAAVAAAQPAAPATQPAPTPTPTPVAAPAPAATAAAATPPRATGPLPLRGDPRLARVRALKEAGDWAACVAQSANPRSIEVLYERSWCVYSLDRPGEALQGFITTMRSGNALGGTVARDAAYGAMLAHLGLNMTEDAARLAATTNLTNEQRREVEATILDQRGVRAFFLGENAQAIAFFTALEALNGSLRRDLGMLRGYAYLNNGQRAEAQAQFELLHRQLATAETRAALRAASVAAAGDG